MNVEPHRRIEYDDHEKMNHKAILLIRNPFNAIKGQGQLFLYSSI